MFSAISGFFQPANRKQEQETASKNFKALSMRMIRCETDDDYEDLWKDFDHELQVAPFLPRKYR